MNVRIRRMWMALAAMAIVCPLAMVSVNAAEDTPLQKQMELVNSHYKKLRTDARRGNFGEAQLKMVREMQLASVQSAAEVPPLADKKPAAEKTKFLIGYKREMQKVVDRLFDLEIAILEGKKDEAKKIVEELNKLKSEGHDKYVEQ